jgi:hypothetical protein
MLRRAHSGVVGCVAAEERVNEQSPRARWGGPVLLARQVQFVLVQRSVRQRPQLVGNCFVPHIIWMKPVGGEQSSSYWVLRSGCAVEREVDRGILPGRSIRVVPGRPAAAAHGHKEEEEDKR